MKNIAMVLGLLLACVCAVSRVEAEATPGDPGQISVRIPLALTSGMWVDPDSGTLDPTSFLLLTRPWVGIEVLQGLGEQRALGGGLDMSGIWLGNWGIADVRLRASFRWGTEKAWTQIFGGWSGTFFGYSDVFIDDEVGREVRRWVTNSFLVGPQVGAQLGFGSSYLEATAGWGSWRENLFAPYFLLGWGWKFSL